MLELPEVLTLASQLKMAAAGKTVRRVLPPTKVHKFCWFSGDPASYDAALRGQVLRGAKGFGIYAAARLSGLRRRDHKGSLSRRLGLLLSSVPEAVRQNPRLRDAEIAKQLGVTPSTVRHQRFVFRERAKAAKLFLAVWTLAEEGKQNRTAQETLLAPHEGAKMVDERYVITEEENQKILENVFYSLEPLRLKVFSKKEKKKIVILRQVAAQFESGRTYTEREVNEKLKAIWDDFATMRRYLVEYGYLDRAADGSSYWKR